VYVTSSNS